MARRARRHVGPSGAPVPAFGLYIHVPFCSAICHYCNFNRGLLDEALKRRYVEAAVSEIRSAPARLRLGPAPDVDTIFFGGGTPSLLDGREISAMSGYPPA